MSPLTDLVEVSADTTHAFQAVLGSATVPVGGLVRTDATGRGEVIYPDGSLTRLDHNTTFRVAALAEATGGTVSIELDAGRVWSRVRDLTGTSDRYEVSTLGSAASVRGTSFDTHCHDEGCTYTVVVGNIEVDPNASGPLDLTSIQRVTVSPEGEPGEVETLTPDDLDDWILFNLALDGTTIDTESAPEPPDAQEPPATQAAAIVFADRGDIWTALPDGSQRTRLGAGTEPSWSPDRQRIAFVRDEAVWVMSANGNDQTLVRSGAAAPTWSPDGSRLAFRGADGIHVMNADGSGVTRLTRDSDAQFTGGDHAPSWSPDGNEIVFLRESDSECCLHSVALDGSGVRQLGDGFGYDPSWAPGGRSLVYAWGMRLCSGTIRVADPDLSQVRDVLSEDRLCYLFSPSFSPDGGNIVFEAEAMEADDPRFPAGQDPLQSGIYVVGADGSGLTWVTTGSSPDW